MKRRKKRPKGTPKTTPEETRRLMELSAWIRGAQRNGYRVIIEANGDVRTEPPVPTPTTDKETTMHATTHEDTLHEAIQLLVTRLVIEPEDREARAEAIALIRELPDGEPISDEAGLRQLGEIYHRVPEARRPLLEQRLVLLLALFIEAFPEETH